MIYLKLLAAFFCCICVVFGEKVAKNGDDTNFEDALLKISTTSEKYLTISYRNKECEKCKLTTLIELNKNTNVSKKISTDYPNYYLYVFGSKDAQYCADFSADAFNFGENGTYSLRIEHNANSSFTCRMSVETEPSQIYIALYVASGILAGAALFYALLKFLYKKYFPKISAKYANINIVNADFGIPILANSSTYLVDEQTALSLSRSKAPSNSNSGRMKSVDVFRGLCLGIMIFANYGSGGYAFLADTVFPCFIFIMGISIPLSFKSIANKATNRDGTSSIQLSSILFKILKRTGLLFFFGLLTSNSSDIYLRDLRIMGVLQRFAISYFACALVELIYFRMNNYKYGDIHGLDPDNVLIQTSKYLKFMSKFKEIFYYPIQWLIVSLFVLLWTLVTFLLPVDGCATGYLGPGGLHENGTHFNCTGGAAGYIDRLVLGINRVYQNPTCTKIYMNQLPHDPEGLLGCLTSCVLTYLGVSCGHIIIHYKEPLKRITRFILYGLIYGLIGLVLCNFMQEDGWIPVNKNLWSLSFILLMASIAFIVLTLFYLLIDLGNIYSGTPFLYLGRNSITIYISHLIFSGYFPFFKVPDSHAYALAADLYGVSIWCIVAAIMNANKVYIQL